MTYTQTHTNLSENLRALVSHVNDSIIGLQKAAEKAKESSQADEQLFLAIKSTREPHARALNSRLMSIGQDEQTGGSAIGAAHRALISIKDLFTKSDSQAALYEEASRGERKLLDYINETFEDLSAIDDASRKAIIDLKGNVIISIDELRRRK